MAKGKYRIVKESFQVYLPPAVGYSFYRLIKLFTSNTVEFKYYFRMFIILLISFIGIPFRIYENLRYKKKIRDFEIKKDPVFIIGHWRSGTTYLHNILCNDPSFCYISTYQSVFPNTVFRGAGRLIFRSFMKLLIPNNRKGDNVKLNVDYPQEEEFTLGANHNNCFYFFWYFPNKLIEFFKSHLLMKDRKDSDIDTFKDDYLKLVKKTLLLREKDILISKNPSNTARIKYILDIFPDARFIYIYRNPVNVILSTNNFFDKMMPVLWFHEINEEERKEVIFDLYLKTMDQYYEDRHLIPESQLFELKFEDLEIDPLKNIEAIYKKFDLENYMNKETLFKAFLEKTSNYKKNKFDVDEEKLQLIRKRVSRYITKLGY